MKGATAYGRVGWRVIPTHDVVRGVCSCEKGLACGRSAGKHPRILGWETKCSSDAATIQGWIDRWPTANVGIATGAPSGFFALDVDPDNGGAETFAALIAKHGELPPTAQARTGSGGAHYLFRMPEFEVSNSAGRLGPGLDIRGTGGQIVVAPSRTLKGAYAWVNPPWNTELADAPGWLLDLVRSRRRPDRALLSDRGYFPAASTEVLDAARRALEAHGPAIQHSGGDTHTFRASAILTHDFALTDDEAWPLLEEWNETCVPPWPEDDLRTKLHNGDAHGGFEYGCRRHMDALEAGRKLLGEWQEAESGEAGMFKMLAVLRTLPFDDQAKIDVFARDVHAATGIPKSKIGLKLQVAVDLPQGSIEVTTQLHRVADLATAAIRAKVYSRGGVLCEPVFTERTFIVDLKPPRLIDLMSECAKFVRKDEKAGLVSQTPPPAVAEILHSRRMHRNIRILEAITTAPVFLADGSILSAKGYNAQARVFLDPNVEVDVPDEPTRDDARGAIKQFADMLCDFKFASKADFSSWLAALLSPLVKAATGNAPSPLTCISASSAGAGKTLLTKAIGQIITGADAEIRPYNPRDPSEWGKRLTSFVKAASPVSVFDNVNGAIGDEGLDKLITSSTWSDRILGGSDTVALPNVTTWIATGNNIEPIQDTVRRVMMVRIEVDTERPQERTGFRHNLDGGFALEHRSELLGAALTILRAYHVAGRPDVKLASWGSFMTWSALVRGALVWAGCADPYETQKRASAELNEEAVEIHDFWLEVIQQTDGTPAAIIALANAKDAISVLELRQDLTQRTLGRLLRRYVDKPRAGMRIRKAGQHYAVEAVR